MMRRSILAKGSLLFLLALFCLLAFYVGTFPLTKLTPSWGRMGYFDWPIFVDAATKFIKSGILYYADMERYAPNAEIYKFPPLFASILVVLLRVGIDPETLRIGIGSLQLLMYFVSIWLGLRISKTPPSFFLYISVFLFIATFEPFINNFIGLQMEAFILFLLCLMLWALVGQRIFLAGFLLGLAVALKLYPLFLVSIILCIDKRIDFLKGLVFGLLSALVFTTLVIGVDQSWLYFSQIAPTLAKEALDTNLRNVSINNAVFQLGLLQRYSHYAGIILMAGAVAAILRSIKHDYDHKDVIAAFCLLVAVLVLGIKNSWGNYQLLLALPIIILLVETFRDKKTNYLSLALIYFACALIFFSPPYRLYFLSEQLFGIMEIPIVKLFVLMRSSAGLIILVLCLRFFIQTVFLRATDSIDNRAPQQ